MTNPLEPNDLSHLSDEEFMALCPQGFHGTGDFEPLADEAILALAEEHGVGYVCPDGCVIYPFQDGTDMRDSLLSFARAVLERWGNYPAIPDSLIQASPPELPTDEALNFVYQSAYQPAWERGEVFGAHYDGLRAILERWG